MIQWRHGLAKGRASRVALVQPRPAPWRRLDRKGAAFGGAVQAVTSEAVAYVGGLRRYRAQANNDGGAVSIWELAG